MHMRSRVRNQNPIETRSGVDPRFFRRAADRFPGMLAIIESNGHALYFNPAMIEYFGVAQERIDGNGWFRYVHEDDRHAFVRSWRRSQRDGTALRAELRLLHPDTKSYRRYVVHGVPLDPLDDGTDAWVVTCIDVEDVRATEAALAEANAHLRTMFDTSRSSIVLCKSNGEVVAANPAVRERVRSVYGQEIGPGDVIWSVLPEAQAAVVREGFRRAQAGDAWETEYHAVGAGGRSIWFHLSCAPVLQHGRVTGVSLSAVDISDRKRAERMREEHEATLRTNRERVEASLREMASELEGLVAQRTEELRRQIVEREAVEADLEVLRQRLVEQGERERGALANGLHDDVLQEVLGLHMNLSSALGPGQADAGSGQLREELERALAGLRKIADALRLTIRGIKPTALEELGLRSALESFVDGMGVEGRPQIVLDFEDVGDLPRELQVCLYRVGQESIRNALKHAFAHRIVASLRRHGGHLILHVSDDGIGFDVPERLSALVRDDHFGLAGIAEHVMAAGGRLRVRSEKGSGTVVEGRFRALALQDAID